jgi:Arc/MetJ-type ribon-helix-helix transcriptional regulator
MGTRSVRLDDETEEAVRLLVERTGRSVSAILKQGVLALRDRELAGTREAPYEIYAKLELGPGGYAQAPARNSREAVRRAIAKRHGR